MMCPRFQYLHERLVAVQHPFGSRNISARCCAKAAPKVCIGLFRSARPSSRSAKILAGCRIARIALVCGVRSPRIADAALQGSQRKYKVNPRIQEKPAKW